MTTSKPNKIFFYVDVNNAFLSWTAVELLKSGYKTDIRTIPSIIAGDEELRHGIVLAKSPVAKELGIKTAETIFQAKKKCPTLKIYEIQGEVYKKYSYLLYKYYKTYTDKVLPYSIDECCLDMTGCIMAGETPEALARTMADYIKKTWGFTVNIGIAPNRLLAKMASDFSKPDKVHTLYPNEIETKMWPLPVSELFMCGKKSSEKLNMLGIKTIGDLAHYDKKVLTKRLGKLGDMLYDYANGIDDEELCYDEWKPKGIGNSRTLPKDSNDINVLEKALLGLCEETTYRLRKEGMLASTVNVSLKTKDFVTTSHQGGLNNPTSSTKLIYQKAKELLHELYHGEYIRLVGVRVDNLKDTKEGQISMFDTGKDEELEKLDLVIDNLKDRFGKTTIKRGGEL
jgi:DNA polymerase-4